MNSRVIADAPSEFFHKYQGLLVGPGTKYARLRAMLDAALQDGLWGEEGRLPTEHELARVTGLSLGTIQRTLRELVAEGRLVRTPGRGTFATKAKYRLDEPFLSARFLADDGSSALPIKSLLISRGKITQGGDWTRVLEPANGELFLVERIFDVGGEFNILNRFYIDPMRFPRFVQLGAREFRSASLRGVLARMYGFPPVTHNQTLRFHQFPPKVCRLIGRRTGTTGLLQSVTATIGTGAPVYFVELFIPPNSRSLRLPDATLTR
jgi:GntR family transcriptional regulator